MNFFRRKNNTVTIMASKSMNGLLISHGARDYLLHEGAEANSFIANYVSETEAINLHNGNVIQMQLDYNVARQYDLVD